MSAVRQPNPASPSSAEGTLGALLYADVSKQRIPEAEWAVLVQRIAAHDQVALHALYLRTHRLVFTLAVRITGSPETAEELTVDTFHEIWKRAGDYDPQGGTVIGWIMNQARSRTLDRLRHQQRKKRVDAGVHDPDAEAVERDASAVAEAAEAARLMREALGFLTPDERLAIETAYFGELTHVQVAERLQQPLGTIKTRIRSGLQKLRHVLGVGGGKR